MKNSFQEKKCWGSENLFGEMKLFVGDTKQIVGEMKQTNATNVIMHPIGQAIEDTFENAQWRKVEQINQMQLCIL